MFSCFSRTESASGIPKILFTKWAEKATHLSMDFNFRIGIPGVPISIKLSNKVQVSLCGLLEQEVHMQLL